MSGWVLAAIAVAGGLGAGARFLMDGAISSRLSSRIPLGTLMVNISGSFALGLVVGLSLNHLVAPEIYAICATGFLGGYTTFSTAATQTVDLIRKGSVSAASLFGGGMFVVSLVAAGGAMALANGVS